MSDAIHHTDPSEPSRVGLVQVIRHDDPTTWDLAWKLKVTPWQKVVSHPSLREAVEASGINFPKGSDKRALVPGCGEGQDVIYIASTLGLSTIGLDISSTALELATSIAKSNPDVPKDLISYKLEDFFNLKPQTDADKYDLVYDYTFFVAIHPSERSEWGRQMGALVKQGGYLIAIAFPMEPETNFGPPWYIRPDHYDEPLAGAFKKVLDKVPENLPAGWSEGLQHLMVWQRV
ncbi:hypothetical protein APHAL10511_004120 [Amanita phalloides]|nr:hypothetical protein APHAL10511_004120 [Amanita phalloides]